MPTADNTTRVDGAIRLLPQRFRAQAIWLERDVRDRAEEFRLRTGFRPTVLASGTELEFGEDNVTPRDLDAVMELATSASAHTSRDTVRRGFVTVRGGYRVGLGGNVITRDGEADGYRAYSSLAIRIVGERRGVAEPVAKLLYADGAVGTLIISPPGFGKTTLLRDLVRLLSDGLENPAAPARRVGLADVRGEIAALLGGVAQLYVGRRTDILDGCAKAEAVLTLVRVMNPEIVALDEVTSPEDIRAIELACLCGAKLVATAHAESRGDLHSKPVYRRMLDSGVFEKLVTIASKNGVREYAVESL
ncbi:MAG: stage III sporulation protein AB [Oscillospiraceae bacterium]|jgi:stage III sporulation protein AA|nr:stage III sporulation protein AB [Oscillospiraceae bacterium]